MYNNQLYSVMYTLAKSFNTFSNVLFVAVATHFNSYVQKGYRTVLGWCTRDGNTLLLVTASWAVQREYKVPLHPWQGHLGLTDPPCVVRGGREEDG